MRLLRVRIVLEVEAPDAVARALAADDAGRMITRQAAGRALAEVVEDRIGPALAAADDWLACAGAAGAAAAAARRHP